jgi:hypothetical protein
MLKHKIKINVEQIKNNEKKLFYLHMLSDLAQKGFHEGSHMVHHS